MLTVTVIGAKVGGLRKLELMPGGGGTTGTPDKFACVSDDMAALRMRKAANTQIQLFSLSTGKAWELNEKEDIFRTWIPRE